MFILCHHTLEIFNFLFIFIGVHSYEFALNLKGDFVLRLFSNPEITKILVIKRYSKYILYNVMDMNLLVEYNLILKYPPEVSHLEVRSGQKGCVTRGMS